MARRNSYDFGDGRTKTDRRTQKKTMTRSVTPVPWHSSHYVFVMPGFNERLDSVKDSWHHSLHFGEKIDVNGPILTKIRPGKWRVWNSSSHDPTSPDRISINIGPLPSVFARKCRLICWLSAVRTRRFGRRYRWRYGSARFDMRNQTCPRININNFIET